MFISVAMPVFAESAPVYDADSMAQFDSEPDQNQPDLPPPPPPSQEGTYGPLPSAPASSRPSLSTEQRIKRMEQQINNMQTNDAAVRVDSLQDQVQSLRGQIEQMTRQLQQIQTQQKSMYTDLDKRLSQPTKPNKLRLPADDTTLNDAASEASSAAAIATSTTKPVRKLAANQTNETATTVINKKSTDSQPDVAEEQQIYQTAYNLIKEKKYAEAVDALQGMLKKYPSGQFASNAHYWLGELYSLMSKNDQALTEFTAVVQNYSDSPRVSDAQLKIGLLYASQSKWSEAKTALKKVINHYPGTASSRLASEQLKQIKQAGH